MYIELTMGNCCGVGRFWWARRSTLGLAGLCRISLSAFTVPATFPGTKVVNLILRGNKRSAVHSYLECFQRCCLGGKQVVVEDFPTTCKRDFAVTAMASCSGMSEVLWGQIHCWTVATTARLESGWTYRSEVRIWRYARTSPHRRRRFHSIDGRPSSDSCRSWKNVWEVEGI